MKRAALLVAIASCGRLDFEPVGVVTPPGDAAVDDGTTSDTIPRACLTNNAYTTKAGLSNRYREGVPLVTWAAARADCIADGADLWVADNALEASAWTGDWVGISDSIVEDVWVTVDGVPAAFLPWAAGQPDGGQSEDCVRVSDGQFEDRACTDLRDYVCECKVN